MDIAARGGLRCIHVAVGVHPDQPKRQRRRSANRFGARRHRPGGQAVIAPKYKRQRTRVERFERNVPQSLTDFRYFAHVFLARIGWTLGFRDRGREISLVHDGAAERRNLIADAGDSERGGPHVDPTPPGAEVERYADDVDRLHFVLYDTDMPSCEGETIVVNSEGWFRMVPRNGSISSFLLTTLCATNTPPGVRRGNTRSKNFL